MPNDPDSITLQEAADSLGVHYMTAYRYVRTGRLPAMREGVKWMVRPADIEALRTPVGERSPKGRAKSEGPAKLAARMVAGDEAGAWALLDAMLGSGTDPLELYLDILVPALRAVGDGWARGELSVADEHRAAAVAQRLVGRLGPRFARRGRKRGTVVVGAPRGEPHGLPCAIVADLLRGAGFEVLDMGADSPAESFVDSVQRANRLVAVLIGVTSRRHDAAVRETTQALQAAGILVPILVGGAAVTDERHARRLGADGWSGADGRSALAAVEATVP